MPRILFAITVIMLLDSCLVKWKTYKTCGKFIILLSSPSTVSKLWSCNGKEVKGLTILENLDSRQNYKEESHHLADMVEITNFMYVFSVAFKTSPLYSRQCSPHH